MDIAENQILETLLPYLKKVREDPVPSRADEFGLPGFSLEDLVGRTISGIKEIENPLPYNPEVSSPNPEKFKVIIFKDGSYLLHMNVGWNDGSTLHTFLVENSRVRYSYLLYD